MRRTAGRVLAGLGAVGLMAGCHSTCHTCEDGCGTPLKKSHKLHGKLKGTCWDVDNCSDIPQGAMPAPVGTYAAEYYTRQATKAEADDLVFYYNEFLGDSTALGPFGAEHLARAVRRVEQTPFNIVLQPDELNPPGVTLARKQYLVEYLAKAGVANPDARVQIAVPQAEGLLGLQAQQINPFPSGGGFGGAGGSNGQFGGGFGGGQFGGGFGGGSGGIGGLGGGAFR